MNKVFCFFKNLPFFCKTQFLPTTPNRWKSLGKGRVVQVFFGLAALTAATESSLAQNARIISIFQEPSVEARLGGAENPVTFYEDDLAMPLMNVNPKRFVILNIDEHYSTEVPAHLVSMLWEIVEHSLIDGNRVDHHEHEKGPSSASCSGDCDHNHAQAGHAQAGHAQAGHAHTHSHSHSHSHSTDTSLGERVQNILKASITRDFWNEFGKKFNFKRIAINLRRLASTQDPTHAQKAEVLKDLVSLFPFSHGFEMASGPLSIAVARIMGFESVALDSALGAIGITISIPGLDPVCYIVIMGYAAEPFRNLVRTSRLFVEPILSAVWNPIEKQFSQIGYNHDPLSRWQRDFTESERRRNEKDLKISRQPHQNDLWLSHVYAPQMELWNSANHKTRFPFRAPPNYLEVSFGANEVKLFDQDERLLMHLEFSNLNEQSNSRFLKRVWLAGDLTARDKTKLLNAIKSLHWNARDAVKEVLKEKPQGVSQRFYVESTADNEVRYHPSAIVCKFLL